MSNTSPSEKVFGSLGHGHLDLLEVSLLGNLAFLGQSTHLQNAILMSTPLCVLNSRLRSFEMNIYLQAFTYQSIPTSFLAHTNHSALGQTTWHRLASGHSVIRLSPSVSYGIAGGSLHLLSLAQLVELGRLGGDPGRHKARRAWPKAQEGCGKGVPSVLSQLGR